MSADDGFWKEDMKYSGHNKAKQQIDGYFIQEKQNTLKAMDDMLHMCIRVLSYDEFVKSRFLTFYGTGKL